MKKALKIIGGCALIIFFIYVLMLYIYIAEPGVPVFPLSNIDFNDGANYTLVYSTQSIHSASHFAEVFIITNEEELKSIKKSFYTFNHFHNAESVGYIQRGVVELFRNGKSIKRYSNGNDIKYGGIKGVKFKRIEQLSEDETKEYEKIKSLI